MNLEHVYLKSDSPNDDDDDDNDHNLLSSPVLSSELSGCRSSGKDLLGSRENTIKDQYIYLWK